MQIEQIYTGCLAHGAYYLTADGEAAIVDPLREIQPYLDRLERDQVKLKYIFETHFHADFVSGHVDLAKKTGATIVYGPTTMKTGFDMHVGYDGEVFALGHSTIQLIHTPGHTMESSCYLLKDEQGHEQGLLTGDTLFIGDVGRPDLAQHVIAELTERKLAGHLFDSLRNKIMPLNDELVIYPNHGAGSACGKNMSSETTDTLGHQKRVNYALDPSLNKETFIEAVLSGLTPPPGYFPQNVLMNINGYESFDSVLDHGMKALSVEEFITLRATSDALVLDTRTAAAFCKGFIPGSVNIGLGGDFAPWAGALIVDVKKPLLLITETGKEQEAITRLSRVGFDKVLGHLKGGFEAWIEAGKETATINRITAKQFEQEYHATESSVIDVRKESEYTTSHLEHAVLKPLAYINTWMPEVPTTQTVYLHCAGGYRSMIAASILQAHGYKNIIEIEGGYAAISKTNLPRVQAQPEVNTAS